MKRILKMMLVLLLLLVQIVPQTLVNAAGTNSNDGTISINNVVEGRTYTIYEILKLESYDESKNAYAYKATDAWSAFVNSATDYLKVDSQGYVTWVEGADVAEFAKTALQYAKDNSIASLQSINANSTTIKTKIVDEKEVEFIEFENLNLGYYLVDSSLGTVCGLTTTDPSAEVYEKNTVPTTTKKVEEDSTGEYGDSNTAQIGQVVNFKTTITIGKGAINYVLHDRMSAGLTLDITSIKVYTNGTENEVLAANYTIIETEDTLDDCTFEIEFANDFIETLTNSDTLVVTYSATVNKDAVIEGEGNPNETNLSFGDNGEHTTEPSTTITYTHDFEVVKTDESKQLLKGAKFELYTALTNGEKIALVQLEDEGEYKVYRVADNVEKSATGFVSAVIEAGKVKIYGLDIDSYYLEETEAPDGYNKLPARVSFTVSGTRSDNLSVLEGIYQENNGLVVVNKTGTELPSTGGIGTMIFILIGTIMVLSFGVLLVTKLRMSKISA